MKKILAVDDEKKIVEIIRAYMEKDGYQVISAFDGQTALDLINKEHPDLVILDLMLPKVSGWEVCRSVRRASDIPVIMLTARDEVTDKIVGLEMGADDYITKPFDPKELVSRVRAVLRRSEPKVQSQDLLNLADLSIDIRKRQVSRAGTVFELTPNEFDILKIMAQNPGQVFTRMQLLDRVQGDAYEGYERTIDSHIKNLRKKIEPDPEHPRYLITVHGVGYKMEER
jgi:DNA-binding response OmpR family regulator